MEAGFCKEKGEVEDDKATVVMFKDRLLRERERQKLERKKEKGKKISRKNRRAAQRHRQMSDIVQPVAVARLSSSATAIGNAVAAAPGYSRSLEELNEKVHNKTSDGKKGKKDGNVKN